MTPTPSATARALRAAAAYVRRHGWTQGMSRNSAGNVCAVGALSHSLTNGTEFVALDDNEIALYYAACVQLRPMLPLPYSTPPQSRQEEQHIKLYAESQLIAYNDRACQGGEDLAELFTQAAEKLEANL